MSPAAVERPVEQGLNSGSDVWLSSISKRKRLDVMSLEEVKHGVDLRSMFSSISTGC